MQTHIPITLLVLALAAGCSGQSTEPPPAQAPAATVDPAQAADKAGSASSPQAAGQAPEASKPPVEPPWLPDEPRTLDPQVDQARLLVEAGQADQALALLDARISAAGDDADAWYWRAKVRQSAGDMPGTEADLRKVVELDPAWVNARQALADLLVGTQRCEEAVPLLLKQVEELPQAGQAWANLGFCRTRGDEPLTGLADLRQGCSLGYARACEAVTRAESRGAPPAP